MGASNTKIDDFDISDKKLGSGQFGEVYKGTLKATGEAIAIKQCKTGKEDALSMAAKEIHALFSVPKHDHIVHIVGYTFHNNIAYIAMEFCDLGDMEGYVKRKKRLTLHEKIDIMYQTACGLEAMHTLKNPVAHRDLKPQNVLFKTVNGQAVAKIGDFGLAKVVDDNTMLRTAMGTMLYMAPEMFHRENYTTAIDVFAMGLVYLALLRFEELGGELIPLPETTNDIRKAQAYGMKIATAGAFSGAFGGAFGALLGGGLGRGGRGGGLRGAGGAGAPMFQFVIKKPGDSEEVKVVKTIIDAMLQAKPKERIKMTEVKRHLGALLGKETKPKERSKATARMLATNAHLGDALDRMKLGASGELTLEEVESGSDDDTMAALEAALGAEGGLLGILGMLADLERGIDKRKAGVTAAAGKFRIGERVCVYPEEEVVKKAQDEKHGGWSNQMACTLGMPGYIEKKMGEDMFAVRFCDGNRFVYNDEILHLAVDEPPAPSGPDSPLKYIDVVEVEPDRKLLRRNQKEKGDWNGKVAMGAGIKGVVHRIHSNGLVTVETHLQETFKYNPKSLHKVDQARLRIEKGDVVIVQQDRRVVIEALGETPGWVEPMEKDRRVVIAEALGKTPGWVEPMEKCLGESGTVLEVRTSGIVKCYINDETWKWHVDCLIILGKKREIEQAVLKKKRATELVNEITRTVLTKDSK